MVTVPPGAPPPLGVGPQALPHSPMIQSERMGVALQRPASVGDCACAEPVSAHSNNAIRNFSSGNRRILDIDLRALTFWTFGGIAERWCIESSVTNRGSARGLVG